MMEIPTKLTVEELEILDNIAMQDLEETIDYYLHGKLNTNN